MSAPADDAPPQWPLPWQKAPAPAEPPTAAGPAVGQSSWNINIIGQPTEVGGRTFPPNLDKVEADLAAERGYPFTRAFREAGVRESYIAAFAVGLPGLWRRKRALRAARDRAPAAKGVDVYGLGSEQYAGLPDSVLNLLLQTLGYERLFEDEAFEDPDYGEFSPFRIRAYPMDLAALTTASARAPDLGERSLSLAQLDRPSKALAYELLMAAARAWALAEFETDVAERGRTYELLANAEAVRAPLIRLARSVGFDLRWPAAAQSPETVREGLVDAAMQLLAYARWRVYVADRPAAPADGGEAQSDAELRPETVAVAELDRRLAWSEMERVAYATGRFDALYAVLSEMDLRYEAPAGVADQYVGYIKSLLTMPARLVTRAQFVEVNGPPGVGKTELAGYLSRCLGALGIYERPRMTPAGRSDLVANFEGQTTLRTRAFLLRDGFEGVVFLDEAYQLVTDGRDRFGREALEALFAYSNAYPETMFILAGYPRELARLYAEQPGLRRRVATTISIEGYTAQQLKRIAVAYLVDMSRQQEDGVPALPLVPAKSMTALNSWIDFAVSRPVLEQTEARVRSIVAGLDPEPTPREVGALLRNALPLGNYVGDLVRVLERSVDLTRNLLVMRGLDARRAGLQSKTVVQAVEAMTAEKRRQFKSARQALKQKE